MSDVQAINLLLPRRVYQALELAARQTHKTETELVIEAVESYLKRAAKIDPLLGLFADEVELIDHVTAEAMRDREIWFEGERSARV